ncbi:MULTISPECIES: BTAD domain-containing putative transcriptional regulator [unclassified Actinotalea]|uniref:AfsR/SARP family transcriptional regulator n=1 Tax=unclassified Actinotalea TaxID=2638618 RepID=UPI0015F3D172|nr:MULTISPECIES: BTAD domain-containing putative transcriptional regulator [unclassified Actinotalea]
MSVPASPPPVELRLLGGFQAWCGADEIRLPRTLQHLVARVALGGRAARALLAGELWPDLPEHRAHGNLRTSIWQVRRLCPDLVADAGDALMLAPHAVVDVHQAHALAMSVIRDAAGVPTDALMPHLHALELLPGWYDDWVLAERERDRQLRVHALELAASELLRRGVPGAAMHAALAAVRLEPLRESAHRAVIEVHLREGNVALALDAYSLYGKLVLAEFGIEPSPALQHLLGIGGPAARALAPHAGHNGLPRTR